MDISQVFPSARSAFHAYPGCFYPISVLPGFIRRSRKIFPPPLCGRLVLLDARKAGVVPVGIQVSNSRLTVVLRSPPTLGGDRLRLLWILTPRPTGLTDYFNPVRAIIVDPEFGTRISTPSSRISFSRGEPLQRRTKFILDSHWFILLYLLGNLFGKIISSIQWGMVITKVKNFLSIFIVISPLKKSFFFLFSFTRTHINILTTIFPRNRRVTLYRSSFYQSLRHGVANDRSGPRAKRG